MCSVPLLLLSCALHALTLQAQLPLVTAASMWRRALVVEWTANSTGLSSLAWSTGISLDGTDQFNLNTNVRQVLESLPGKTSDVFGKCLNVCAVAISDTEPERRLLGLALLQILLRLLLTPAEHGWTSDKSGRIVRRRIARFLDGEWRALWDESSRYAESSRSNPFAAELEAGL